MIRTLKEGVDCINSLCENFPRFTSFYDEKGNRVNGGVCRLFLKNEMGEYTIPTPFFGFWGGDFAGERVFLGIENGKLNIEEYYKLAIAGDCVHNFINFCQENASFVYRGNKKYKFYEPVIAKSCGFYCKGNNNLYCVGFAGKPIYPDILFSDFLYSTVFNFGKEGWTRFFEFIGKCVFLSSPMWGIVNEKGRFNNFLGLEFVHVTDVSRELNRIFKEGKVVLDDSPGFEEQFIDMCSDCIECKYKEESLDKLGKWLVSKGYQLSEIEKMYCCVDAFDSDGKMCFERGLGYDFAEIAFALLRKE